MGNSETTPRPVQEGIAFEVLEAHLYNILLSLPENVIIQFDDVLLYFPIFDEVKKLLKLFVLNIDDLLIKGFDGIQYVGYDIDTTISALENDEKQEEINTIYNTIRDLRGKILNGTYEFNIISDMLIGDSDKFIKNNTILFKTTEKYKFSYVINKILKLIYKQFKYKFFVINSNNITIDENKYKNLKHNLAEFFIKLENFNKNVVLVTKMPRFIIVYILSKILNLKITSEEIDILINNNKSEKIRIANYDFLIFDPLIANNKLFMNKTNYLTSNLINMLERVVLFFNGKRFLISNSNLSHYNIPHFFFDTNSNSPIIKKYNIITTNLFILYLNHYLEEENEKMKLRRKAAEQKKAQQNIQPQNEGQLNIQPQNEESDYEEFPSNKQQDNDGNVIFK